MTESTDTRPRGRLTLLLIALIFLGPLAFAAWLYYSGETLQPEGRANHGILLEPITSLPGAVPGSAMYGLEGNLWKLVYVHTAACEDDCRNGLYTIRQIRLMLGREMDRVERVFLHGDAPLDTLYIQAEHEGLVALPEMPLAEFLVNRIPPDVPPDGYFLVDPLGNLVLYFPPGINPRDMVSDIKRLLRLSRIG
ncbi:MAG: hypothetical protein V2I25_10690 [Woeseiaceae bacterium]|jgi:hypothetical protein|nr:hypothetical protein [Woeseiaceae bacterium]